MVGNGFLLITIQKSEVHALRDRKDWASTYRMRFATQYWKQIRFGASTTSWGQVSANIQVETELDLL